MLGESKMQLLDQPENGQKTFKMYLKYGLEYIVGHATFLAFGETGTTVLSLVLKAKSVGRVISVLQMFENIPKHIPKDFSNEHRAHPRRQPSKQKLNQMDDEDVDIDRVATNTCGLVIGNWWSVRRRFGL